MRYDMRNNKWGVLYGVCYSFCVFNYAAKLHAFSFSALPSLLLEFLRTELARRGSSYALERALEGIDAGISAQFAYTLDLQLRIGQKQINRSLDAYAADVLQGTHVHALTERAGEFVRTVAELLGDGGNV